MNPSAGSRNIIVTPEAVSDKRSVHRHDRVGEVFVVWHHGGQKFTSRVHDLSLSGAFVESADPPQLGTALTLFFQVSGKFARVQAVVRRSVPRKGMGIEFVAMEDEDRACLTLATELSQELIPAKVEQQAAFIYGKGSSQRLRAKRHEKVRALTAERRHHLRLKVTAQVQVVELDSGTCLGARLGNLSAGGCFLDLETNCAFSLGTTVMVAITRGSEKFQSKAKVVYVLPPKSMGVTFTDTEPQDLRILGAWIMETTWLAADRRKGQRIYLGVPVKVIGNNSSGESFTEETRTIKVGADGCSLLLAAPVNKGQYVTLMNFHTNARMGCVVVRIVESSAAQHEIGMSFLLPNKKFWPVTFPPVDWSAYHLEAER
jgi:hypothetical protein